MQRNALSTPLAIRLASIAVGAHGGVSVSNGSAAGTESTLAMMVDLPNPTPQIPRFNSPTVATPANILEKINQGRIARWHAIAGKC